MYFDINQDGVFSAADLQALIQDNDVAQAIGELIGYAALSSGNTADEQVIASATQILGAANGVVAKGDKITGRGYAERAIALLNHVNHLASGDTKAGNYVGATLAALGAFVTAYNWEDGTQPGEVPAAVTLMIQPILTAILSGTLGGVTQG